MWECFKPVDVTLQIGIPYCIPYKWKRLNCCNILNIIVKIIFSKVRLSIWLKQRWYFFEMARMTCDPWWSVKILQEKKWTKNVLFECKLSNDLGLYSQKVLRQKVAPSAEIWEQLLKIMGMWLLILGIVNFSSKSNSQSFLMLEAAPKLRTAYKSSGGLLNP